MGEGEQETVVQGRDGEERQVIQREETREGVWDREKGGEKEGRAQKAVERGREIMERTGGN